MSNTQAYEEVTVSDEGVTVVKQFEADEFPVPAIAFRIQSQRIEPVTVKLTDEVPEDVAVEDLGFHPEYGSEHWTIDGQTIIFEREIDADSEYTTVYGIRATGTDDVEKFLTEPEIDSVDPPLDDEGDLVDDASSDVVRDVIAGDSDSVPGLEDTDDEEIETLNLADPNDSGETGDSETSDGDEGDDAVGQVQPGSVAKTLAAEIRQDAVDDAALRVLKQELDLGGSGGDTDGSAVDARIQHLQSEMSDLAAYTSALEEFLAENGQGEELIEEFQGRLDEFQGELDGVRSELDSMSGNVESVEETVSSNAETVSELDGDVDSIEGTVESLDDELDGLREEVESMSEQLGEDGDLADRLDDVESEIEELKEWREQLSSVIGGAE
ncbi:transducer protein [Halorhabdus tiamatea SARL4B]|uniref:Uncharacterized protein n=1 Tax=Halorhabdus tiamatea SARL4B TaxID=1033806 RepID=F7PF30_9EURY|nr:hypothetical protein [Halorhabdus tiamatea]ERJ06018.1 transducer protein [Halorhabdus tiamatea SARL4B]CCQ34420.1 conserved hypothetical protein [Halorhabdus tiamatea SARL4B]